MLNDLSELQIFGRTLYGEARGEVRKYGDRSLMAVAQVILNRMDMGSLSIRDVCLKPFQFSCWNKVDPNYRLLCQKSIFDPVFERCLQLAENFMNQRPADITLGATHYHTRFVSPYWSKGLEPLVQIGSHLFFRL